MFNRWPQDGEVLARPAKGDGIDGVPDGLVHHWIGTTFIAGVKLEGALRVSYRYDDYRRIYEPIIASRILRHDVSMYEILLRIRETAGGMTAVLDVMSRVEYFFPTGNSAYSISTSEDIREIKEPGGPREERLPAGHDSGYLWRAMTFHPFCRARRRRVDRSGDARIEPKLSADAGVGAGTDRAPPWAEERRTLAP